MSFYKLLPIMLISKKKIANVKVDYENYLIELLNKAFTFKRVLNLPEPFEKINEQAHGECDACSGDYKIDFKLLIPTEFMKIKNSTLPDVDYNNLNDGFISVNNNKMSLDKALQDKAEKSFINYIANIALSNKDNLLKIKDDDTILSSSIKNMLVNKNILCFIPCIFDKNINSMSLVRKLFLPLLSIRQDIEKDTYITYLQNDYFYILQYRENDLLCIDKIHRIMVSTFNDLYKLTYFI